MKDTTIKIRISSEDKEKLEKAGSKAGYETLSQFIRNVLKKFLDGKK